MKRSFPLAQFSAFSRQFTVSQGGGLGESVTGLPSTFTRYLPPATSHSARRSGAFTLIELLVVIAIIAILAALTLSTLGYVNKKGAESRARSEVAALSAAIDAYKLEFGSYPATVTILYGELVGDTSANGGAVVNTSGKVFLEPSGQMINTNVSPWRFWDPWGVNYEYTTNPTVNVGFFDLWTTNNSTNPALWIRN